LPDCPDLAQSPCSIATHQLFRILHRLSEVGGEHGVAHISQGDGGISLKVFLVSNVVIYQRLHSFGVELIRQVEEFGELKILRYLGQKLVLGQLRL